MCLQPGSTCTSALSPSGSKGISGEQAMPECTANKAESIKTAARPPRAVV